MPSLMAFSGINVGRAFPGLGKDAATRRRALAMSALVSVARLARENEVDAIVVVGGLFDDRSVGTATLTAALQVLESAGVRVLIAPGAADPLTAGGEYETRRWTDSISVWMSTEFEAANPVGGIDIVGRACHGVWDSAPQIPAALVASPCIIIGDGIESAKFDAEQIILAVTTGTTERSDSQSTVLRPINGELGEPFGHAAIINIDEDRNASTTWVDLLPGTPSTVDLDVSSARTTDDLRAQIEATQNTLDAWSVIRLTGELQPGVVLSSALERSTARDDIVIKDEALAYAFDQPEPDDHSALAEFVRSLAGAAADDRTRHQAMAFGLLALQSSALSRDPQ